MSDNNDRNLLKLILKITIFFLFLIFAIKMNFLNSMIYKKGLSKEEATQRGPINLSVTCTARETKQFGSDYDYCLLFNNTMRSRTRRESTSLFLFLSDIVSRRSSVFIQ